MQTTKHINTNTLHLALCVHLLINRFQSKLKMNGFVWLKLMHYLIVRLFVRACKGFIRYSIYKYEYMYNVIYSISRKFSLIWNFGLRCNSILYWSVNFCEYFMFREFGYYHSILNAQMHQTSIEHWIDFRKIQIFWNWNNMELKEH